MRLSRRSRNASERIPSSGPTSADFEPAAHARHRRHVDLALINLRAAVDGRNDHVDVGAYVRMALAMVYEFHEATKRADRKAAVAAGLEASGGQYQRDLLTSAAGQTLSAMLWARGEIAHGDVTFQVVEWIPIPPAELPSNYIRISMSTDGGTYEPGEPVRPSWSWIATDRIQPKRSTGPKDKRNKAKEYQTHLAGHPVIDTFVTVEGYLAEALWSQRAARS